MPNYEEHHALQLLQKRRAITQLKYHLYTMLLFVLCWLQLSSALGYLQDLFVFIRPAKCRLTFQGNV